MSDYKKIEHPQAEDGFITPSHYMREGHLEHIDIQEAVLSKDEFIGFCKSLIIKYIVAKREKNIDNQLRAAKKAKYYITELINYLSRTTGEKVSEEHIKPSYYTSQSIQPIVIIEDILPFDQLRGVYIGNVVRYLYRSPLKGHEFDDLNKAKYYIDRYVEYLENYKK